MSFRSFATVLILSVPAAGHADDSVLTVHAAGSAVCADDAGWYPIPSGTRRTATEPVNCVQAGFWARPIRRTRRGLTTQVVPTPLRYAVLPLAVLAAILGVLAARRLRGRVTHLGVQRDGGLAGYRDPASAAIELVELPPDRVAVGALHEALEGWSVEIERERWGVRIHDDVAVLEPNAQQPIGVAAGSSVLPGTVLSDGERECVLLDPAGARRARGRPASLRWPEPRAAARAAEGGPWFSLTIAEPTLVGAAGVGGASAIVALGLSFALFFAPPWFHLVVVPGLAGLAAAGFVVAQTKLGRPRGTSGTGRARRVA